MIEIVELIDRRELVDTVVAWIQFAWPNGNRDRFFVEDRLCGEFVRGKLPQALVALMDGRPVGFVSMIFHIDSAGRGRPYWIDALYVDLPYRRKGLGSVLLKHAEEKAKHLKLSSLFALTELRTLYEKNGWTLIEKVGGTNPLDVIMEKTIATASVR